MIPSSEPLFGLGHVVVHVLLVCEDADLLKLFGHPTCEHRVEDDVNQFMNDGADVSRGIRVRIDENVDVGGGSDVIPVNVAFVLDHRLILEMCLRVLKEFQKDSMELLPC